MVNLKISPSLVLFCIVAAVAKPLTPVGPLGSARCGRVGKAAAAALPAEGPVKGISVAWDERKVQNPNKMPHPTSISMQ
jgi:hypothetical protein